ncbi:hypothetical protein M885DRAFT_619671 [Pelagophyceae sp. CCMP2097]|nr:hypothetical protein M885DRAFT_619671 [Pelagophyceae sp. CCMP2097]
MLRREPTRIEMKPEDIEEFDQYAAQQKKLKEDQQGDAAPAGKQPQSTANRIGLARNCPPSDSPEY